MWNYIFISGIILLVSLLYHYNVSKPLSIIQYPEDRYDYIVVGAGTAGCVMASRLSELPNKSVLLIEAGGYFNWLSNIPLAAPLMQGTSVDWTYKTESQYYASRGFVNHQASWPRGKGLGGSGQMNFLLHSFGKIDDYKKWPSGWTYHNLKPYFDKVSRIMGVPGTPVEGELTKIFTGIDVSGIGGNITIEKAENTIKRGKRFSSYQAYLQPAWNRKNLHILPDTLVVKILFEDDKKTVEGIKVKLQDGTLGTIAANDEVILCAGAVNTPHLMMVSGVGPFEELKQNRIPVIKAIPEVGKNLFDHLNIPMYVSLKIPVSITLRKMQSLAEIMKYLVFESGLLATNGVVGTASRGDSGFILFGVGSQDEKLLNVSNYDTQVFRAVFPSYNSPAQEGVLVLANCLQPQSRGNITLNTYTILDPPRIDPAYLEDSRDIRCTQDAINLVLDIIETLDFRKLGPEVHIPDINDCRYHQQDYRDENYSECIMRYSGVTGYHPGGTCRMGDDKKAVVDRRLRVNGIRKLRIVDASILPNPISGTPNSVIIAIAEKAADVILNVPLKTVK
ncbi:neither inactivation nor afterpotential protein G [Fopius arisanus]|uniref:Neither inactivation nor afterpotential protein G n=1 Tax=Fopius arisanus TaxID=64838 RepID=A0A9R1TL65_9HYME|nr:PREDICTED: neither inactivation nor afterpotential protein G [Fopius arisanus]